MNTNINTVAKRRPVVHHQYHNENDKLKESELSQHYKEVLAKSDCKEDILFFIKGIMDKDHIAVNLDKMLTIIRTKLIKMTEDKSIAKIAQELYASAYAVRKIVKDKDHRPSSNHILVLGYSLVPEFREKFKP